VAVAVVAVVAVVVVAAAELVGQRPAPLSS